MTQVIVTIADTVCDIQTITASQITCDTNSYAYSSIKAPEGALLLFRNIFHFGVSHIGYRWLLFFYLDQRGSQLLRKSNETFKWGGAIHVDYILNNNDIPPEIKKIFHESLFNNV